MRNPARFVITFLGCIALALTVTAGPEPMVQSSKETKEIIPPPPPVCDWSGVYIGLHAGGEFGHSQTNDLDEYYVFAHHHFGYDESGFVGGGQAGYNFQFGPIVLGPEFDIGYMDLDGQGHEKIRNVSVGEAIGETDSDFYLTFRGRIGYAPACAGCWLFYVTGGVMGINYETRYMAIEEDTGKCGVDARKQEFNWGPTVGGGIERQLGRHWSIKVEYLWFTLDEQSFSGLENEIDSATSRIQGSEVQERFHFQGETQGHIVRGGLNFRF